MFKQLLSRIRNDTIIYDSHLNYDFCVVAILSDSICCYFFDWKILSINIKVHYFFAMQEQGNKQKVNKQPSFICQACLLPQQNVQLCKCCLSINCKQCRISHSCSLIEGQYHKTPNCPTTQLKEFDKTKQKRQTSLATPKANTQDLKNMNMKQQSLILCNRCSLKQASAYCTTCKIKYYCNSCFADIHSATKLSKHQHAPIQQYRQNPSFSDGLVIKLSLKQPEISQQCRNVQNSMQKPCETVLSIQANLDMMRRRLQFNKNSKICQLNETTHNIEAQFQSILRKINEKQQQVILFLTQHQKSLIESYENMEKTLNSEEVCLQNIKIMKEYHRQSIQADRKCSVSQQSCMSMMNKIQCETSDHIGIQYQDITKQFMLFQQRLQKISLKRSLFQMNRTKDMRLASSSTEQTSRCNIKSKRQEKTNKKSVNHSQSKSLSKFCPALFTLTSPKNIMRNSAKPSHFNSNAIIQSIVNESGKENIAKESKCNEIKKNPYLNNKTQIDDSPIKQTYIDAVLSPSIKRSKRNSENNPYQIIGNYGKYVEKAKKRSNEVKADIIQLTKFAYFSSVTNSQIKK